MNKTDGCWLWLGAPMNTGYGQIEVDGKDTLAHRYAYELLVGPIPEGLTIDHLCRVRLCVRPDHLEVVTLEENKRRGEGGPARNARKTHCVHGHPFSGDNLYIVPRTGWRQCRTCARERWRKRQAEEQLEMAAA